MTAPTPEEDVAPAIGAASRAMIGAMLAGVSACGFEGMTPAFASIVPLLDASGARPTALAQRAGVTKQAVSQLVRELEKRGYAEQIPDPSDTRAKLVRLTQRGVQLRTTCAAVRKTLTQTALDVLGPERTAQLRQDLLLLAQALASKAPS